jgi:hypothetical protein
VLGLLDLFELLDDIFFFDVLSLFLDRFLDYGFFLDDLRALVVAMFVQLSLLRLNGNRLRSNLLLMLKYLSLEASLDLRELCILILENLDAVVERLDQNLVSLDVL